MDANKIVWGFIAGVYAFFVFLAIKDWRIVRRITKKMKGGDKDGEKDKATGQ